MPHTPTLFGPTLLVRAAAFFALALSPLSIALAQATQPTATAPASAPATTAATDNPVVVMKTNHGDVTIELLADAAPKTVANFLELAAGEKPFTDISTGEEVKRPFYDGLTFHRIIPGFMIQGGDPRGNGTGGPGYEMQDEINADALGLDKKPAFSNGQPDRMLGLQSPMQLQQMLQRSAMGKLGIVDQASFDAKRDQLEAEMNRLRQEMNKVVQEGKSIKAFYELIGYEYTPGLPSVLPTRGVLAMANSGPNTQGSQFFINLGDTPWLAGKHTVFGRVIDGMDVVDAIAKVPTGAGNAPNEPVVIESIRLKRAPATQPE